MLRIHSNHSSAAGAALPRHGDHTPPPTHCAPGPLRTAAVRRVLGVGAALAALPAAMAQATSEEKMAAWSMGFDAQHAIANPSLKPVMPVMRASHEPETQGSPLLAVAAGLALGLCVVMMGVAFCVRRPLSVTLKLEPYSPHTV